MESNTELHQLTRYPLSLHKFQVNPLATSAEAGDFSYEPAEIRTASSFILN